MKVHRAAGIALAVLLMVALLPWPGAAAIGVDDPHLRLGKVDPGHKSTYQRNVTNTGTAPVTVDVRVTCPCPVYVTVSPSQFELAPGAKRTLAITVDVPADADPGAHDTQIQVTERASGGTGGTAVASATISAFFQVRTAGLFLNPPSGGDTLPVRFVNAYEETLQVEIEGTLEGIGVSRPIGPHTAVAPGSGPGARVTTIALPLPFQETDPAGGYAVTLRATWTNATTGADGTSGPHTIDIAHGALVTLEGFTSRMAPNGLQVTGTLRSAAPEPVEAWLALTFVPTDGGAGTTVESDRVVLDAFGTAEIAFTWQPDRVGRHTLHAQALYLTKDGTRGASSDWPATELVLDGVGTVPGRPPETDTTPGGAGTPGAAPVGSNAVLGLVALAGLGVGAAVAILVNRRGRS